jgi:hypothetical protein
MRLGGWIIAAAAIGAAAVALAACGSKPAEQPAAQQAAPAAAPAAPAANALTADEAAAGWALLWDGKTFTGWHTYGKQEVVGWEIANGELVALGQGGDHANDILTDAEYENFEFVVDWKISPRANSGIFYNVVEQGYDRVYATGPEYQIIDEDGWPEKLEDWQKNGANYAMHPPLAKAARPVGEWNTSRIVVDKGHVEHWLNGVKTAEYDLWTPEWTTLKTTGKWKEFPGYGIGKKGKIGLQDHGNKVYFRNIKIRTR